eukprot:TRINITY_DN38336_c0_g1_i1.p1 TRINITY_DN38336_c0_g1~~TRINITY_DN38336_c0_g1_i1.p1  ORF type:complete len:1173 (+),score=271.92 TRINITY_DN38336_c0_g1_i1:469-3519(+)
MDKAGGRSEASRHMLHNIVPTSLGTPEKKRSADQHQASLIIGKALRSINRSLRDNVAAKENDLRTAVDKAKIAENSKHDADKAAMIAKDDLEKKVAAYKHAEDYHQKKLGDRDQAKETHTKALDDVAAAEREKKMLDDLYNNNFLPLKRGECLGPVKAKPHLDVLRAPLRRWGCEDCLFAGFETAGATAPDKRGPHCKSTVDETEKLFGKPKRDAEAKLNKAKDIADKAANEAARAVKAAEDADKARARAGEKVLPSERAHSDAQKSVEDADRKLQDANNDVEYARSQTDDAKRDAKEFNDGPQADYDALCKHNVPGYDPTSVPAADGKDDAKDPGDKKRVEVAQRALAANLNIDSKTHKMLSEMAPGALGPKKGERDDLQKEGVEMIKRRLNDHLNDLEDDIDNLAAGGYPSDAAIVAAKKAAEKAKAAGKSLQDVGKAAADAAKQAGGSISVASEAAGLAAADTSLSQGKSPADAVKAAADAAKAAGGSPNDVINAAAGAAARAAQAKGLSPAEAGALAAEAVKSAGGSPSDAAIAAAKAAGKAAHATGDDPAKVGEAASLSAKAAGASPPMVAKLAGEAAGDAASKDGKLPHDVCKAASVACKVSGGTPEDAVKAGAAARAKAEGMRAADKVRQSGGSPYDAAKFAGRATTDASDAPLAELAKLAAAAAQEAGGSPSDIAKAAADASTEAAIASSKSPAEVAKAAADVAKAAGGATEDFPRLAGNAAGKAARDMGKSPAEVGKVVGDAAKAQRATSADAAKVAGRQAGKTAEEAGKSPEEVGEAAGAAAKSAGGTPADITRAVNAAKLADLLKNDPEKAPAVADTIVANRRKDVDDARNKMKEACEGGCSRAKRSLDDATKQLESAERKCADLEDAYAKHFLPLKDGVGSPDDHLKALKLLLDEYGCDPCLKAGFYKAACHKPGERGLWCQKCVDEVEKFFAQPRKLARDQVAIAKSAVNKAAASVEQARKTCEAAEVAYLRSLEELKAAELLKLKVAELNERKAQQAIIHDE